MMVSYNLENLKFLIVEDDGHWQKIVRALFVAIGAKNVQVVDDCESALEKLAEDPADILICDWMMSHMSGIEMVRQLRDEDHSPNPFIPIIMLTAHTEKKRILEARDAGANEVLTKPVSAKNLYEHIVGIVEKPRQFVRADTYFGPDRRRKVDMDYKGPERRIAEDGEPADTGSDLESGQAKATVEPAKSSVSE